MEQITKPKIYRDLIDRLVKMCRDGQGAIGPNRARRGIWNANATPDSMPDQHRINQLLARLSAEDREVIAEMLSHEVVVGVFETLKALEEFQIPPFEEGYEGSPYEDFIGRIATPAWEWPER